MMVESGTLDVQVENQIARVTFGHPKKNSLPGELLRGIAGAIREAGARDDVRVIVLQSEGDGPFCAGASFDELLAIETEEQGHHFFSGFAQVILAVRDCPVFVLCRVQGKAVGGGCGLIAACDYAIAAKRASIRLSEFALGFGPFVIGPAVERRIGTTAFSTASIDTRWLDADWSLQHGLFTQVVDDTLALDAAVTELAEQLAKSNKAAITELKRIFTTGTEGWEQLLGERAGISARLALSDFVQDVIRAIKAK